MMNTQHRRRIRQSIQKKEKRWLLILAGYPSEIISDLTTSGVMISFMYGPT
jgi:hypothetical protein